MATGPYNRILSAHTAACPSPASPANLVHSCIQKAQLLPLTLPLGFEVTLALDLSQDPKTMRGEPGCCGRARHAHTHQRWRLQQGRASQLASGWCPVPAVPGAAWGLTVSLSGRPAAVQPEAAGNLTALFWECDGAPGCLAAAEISAPLVSRMFSSPLMIRQSSVIMQSSEPLMARLRVLITAVVVLKWKLPINRVYFSPLMQRPSFLLSFTGP